MKQENNYEIIPAEEDKFPLRIRRYSGSANFAMHWHGHMELLYFIKGGVSLYCGGAEYAVKDGDLIIINPNELHRGDMRQVGTDYLCVMLPPLFFDWLGGEMRSIFITRISADSCIEDLMLRLYRSFEGKKDGYRYLALGCAYELIAYLTENYAAAQLDKNEYAARNSKLENFNNVIEYIEKNYSDPITTSKAAQLVHLSEYYFCHLFKKHIGCSFTAYLNEIRVQKAQILLKNTKMSVTEIAAEVGFNDINYFCRVFRRFTGFSPTQYKSV